MRDATTIARELELANEERISVSAAMCGLTGQAFHDSLEKLSTIQTRIDRLTAELETGRPYKDRQ